MAIHFENPKATFIHIPKTAGSSFEQWVYTNIPDYARERKHAAVAEATDLFGDLGTTFTFVRNPYDRLVSQFHFVGQRAQERIEKRAQGRKVKKSTTQEWDIEISKLYNTGFDNWINLVYNKEESAYDLGNHLYKRGVPQTIWFDGKIDIVIKIENLKTDFKILQELFNCYIDLPVTNTSKRSHYRDYYTNKETRRMADAIVAPDLEKFGYEF